MAKVAPLIGHADSGEAARIAHDVILSVERPHANHPIVHLVYTQSEAV